MTNETVNIPNLFNTGVGLSNGQIDYHYTFKNLNGTATGTDGHTVAAVGNGWPISTDWVADNSICNRSDPLA